MRSAFRRLLCPAVLLVALVGLARPVAAASITVNGDTSFTVNWLNTAVDPDLAGQATFTITNFTDTSFDLAISNVKNTTATNPNINARLTSFGFGLTPNAATGGFTNIVNGDVSAGVFELPSLSQVDVCGFADKNCAGGQNDGLNQGQSTALTDIMSITIAGDFANGVTFSPSR